MRFRRAFPTLAILFAASFVALKAAPVFGQEAKPAPAVPTAPAAPALRNIERESAPADEPRRPVAAKSLAIVIGVQNYAVAPLKFCHNDAKRVADVLRQMGYQDVQLLLDDGGDSERQPTIGNLSKKLRQKLVFADADRYDRVLFYFSGHGFRNDKGELYLAPNDFDPKQIELTCFPLRYVVQQLDGCRNVPVKLVVLDCCHAGAGKGGREAFGGQEIDPIFSKARGTLTLASSTSNEVSLEWPDKQQGVFSYWLCEGLLGKADRDSDGVVDHEELHRFVFRNVWDTAAKLGHEQTVKLVPSDDWQGLATLTATPRIPRPEGRAKERFSEPKPEPRPSPDLPKPVIPKTLQLKNTALMPDAVLNYRIRGAAKWSSLGPGKSVSLDVDQRPTIEFYNGVVMRTIESREYEDADAVSFFVEVRDNGPSLWVIALETLSRPSPARTP